MPNGESTVMDWLIHIDEQQRNEFARLHDKLDGKVDKADLERVEERVDGHGKRLRHQEVKMAGIAGLASGAVVWFKSYFVG